MPKLIQQTGFAKIGRNDRCPCGSGKKFKKCHIDHMQDLIPQEAIDHFNAVLTERATLENQGIKMNFVRPLVFKGKKVWAIRNRIYYNRPPQETFHEFIVFILQQNLGKKWWDAQKAASDKHFIMQCFEAFGALKPAAAIPENQHGEHLWSAEMDGPIKYLLALAFDIASLQNTQPIPEGMMKRLRHKDQFQGARYELGIAGIFARLGLEVTFLDDLTPPGAKHCEFIAKNPKTGLEVAIEVKSRHRPGVLHTAGDYNQAKAMRGDVERLFHDALEQSPDDKPFLVFIDVNAPFAENEEALKQGWYKDIQAMLQKEIASAPATPTVATAVYITNYAYHYQHDKAGGHEVSEHISSRSQHPINDQSFYEDLARALRHYGSVPSFDVDGVLGG